MKAEGRRQKAEVKTLTRTLLLAVVSAFCLLPSAFPQRLATDFEIAQMERQLAASRDFEAQFSARLNLGDLRLTRNEVALGRKEYERALDLAGRERLRARRASDITRYAIATSYAALAEAKLGRDEQAFALFEESLRYASDDAEAWNLYASGMRALGHPRKGVSAARQAVTIASRNASSSIRARLDLAVQRHALATALIDAGANAEAEKLLLALTAELRSDAFERVRREAARTESFEIYSMASGDVAAWVALVNRAELRLARLYEDRGDVARASEHYRRALAQRTDDVTALSALARLARSDEERERLYESAFDANPFSPALVREYRLHLSRHEVGQAHGNSTGSQMRRALQQIASGDLRSARVTLDGLLRSFPANETIKLLRREAEGKTSVAIPSTTPTPAELQALLDSFESLAPEQRSALDARTFTSDVVFDGAAGTTFESGRFGEVLFRFSEPTVFAVEVNPAARLTYRILGVTRLRERHALLLEPLRVESQ